jgi:alcohol dehydrogenase
MAILLPYGLEYNQHRNGHLTAELLFPLEGADAYARTPRANRAARVIARIRDLNQSLHDVTQGAHPRCLGETYGPDGHLAVPKKRFPDIVSVAKNDGSTVYNPEALDDEDIVMVLEHAWEGTPLDRSRIRKG